MHHQNKMVKEIYKLLLFCISLILCADQTTRDGRKRQQSLGKEEYPSDMGNVLSFTQLRRNIPTEDHKVLDTSSNDLGNSGWQFFS